MQRPENVLAGYLAWPDYRPKDAPDAIRIVHHKTGATVWHPLEEVAEGITLDACRHGGMTELEEAELMDGQGRALSGHRTQAAYAGYAKRTLARALPATRKRYAHLIATRNAAGTSIQNEARTGIQNDDGADDAALA